MRPLIAATLVALLPVEAVAAMSDRPKAPLPLARDMEEVWQVGVQAITKWPGLQHFSITPRPAEPSGPPELDFNLSSDILSDTGRGLQETAEAICQMGNTLNYEWRYTWVVEITDHNSDDPQAIPEVASCTMGADGMSKYR